MPWEMSRPDRNGIVRLLREHDEEHRKLPESARERDLGGERALLRDYAGRVVFELIQNALDRADRKIVVRWLPDRGAGGSLVVGNDGLPVSAYDRPADPEVRLSDFHALLSLHSSAKRAQESIGNKGVGFRSVFASAREVEVWSHASDGGWWGMRLQHPARLDPRPAGWTSDEAASFYLPEQLCGEPGVAGVDAETLVCLRAIPPDSAEMIVEAIGFLRGLPLVFLERRAQFQDGRLSVVLDDGANAPSVQPVGLPVEWEISHAERVGLRVPQAVRDTTGLDLETAEVRVLLSPVNTVPLTSLYWSYLPTEQPSGHGLHVHADFYLHSSRRAVTFRHADASDEPPTDPPGWNGWLLEHVADLVVNDLWTRKEICLRPDFWRMASPSACLCQNLRRAVAVRVLSSRERFCKLVVDGFAVDPSRARWPVARYRDFFEALETWVRAAYQFQAEAGGERLKKIAREDGGDQLYMWRQRLWRWVRESEASVLPIVEAEGEESQVTRAQPIQEAGSRSVHIYLRRTEGFRLPDAIAAQETYITLFDPPGSKDVFRLTEFTRPAVLARLRPGRDDGEHGAILAAAVRLAAEEPERGGYGSVLSRGPGKGRFPWWRFTLEDGELSQAGDALASLRVPVIGGGWQPASEVVRPGTWPDRSEVDEARLCELLEPIPERDRPDVNGVCALLGIGGAPVTKATGSLCLDGWDDLLHGERHDLLAAAQSILSRWDTELGVLVSSAQGTVIRSELTEGRWLPEGLKPQLVGGRLQGGVTSGFPMSPHDLWSQHSRYGFRTRLLPRIELERDPVPWMIALGIGGVGESDVPEKIIGALMALRKALPHPDPERASDLEQTYGRLVDRLPDDPARVQNVPILVRRTGVGIGWRRPDESVWHDTGDHSHALAAFPDASVWVVRRGPRRVARALGIEDFAPTNPQVEANGPEDSERKGALEEALRWALPDLFTAAVSSPVQPRFPAHDAVGRAAILRVRHAREAWLLYTFDGRTGTLGKDDGGDAFLVPEGIDGPAYILFGGPGPDLPLDACGRLLSELLCENRAYAGLFSEGLSAWAHGGVAHDGSPPAVRRFRRNHGVSEEDVRAWRERLEAARFDPARAEAWRNRAARALRAFGTPNLDAIEPGRSIRPEAWRPDEALKRDTTQDEVEQALDQEFRGTSGFDAFLVPSVMFRKVHEPAFLAADRKPYIAAAAVRAGRTAWREELFLELQEKAAREPDDSEVEAFNRLWCDVDKLLRCRFDLPSDTALSRETLDPSAWAFAKGQIRLDTIPKPESVPGRLAEWTAAPPSAVLEALSDDAWMKKAQRQATGGGRAEDAVVALARNSAFRWLRADAQGFWSGVRTAMEPLWKVKVARERFSAARTNPSDAHLFDLLKVSVYVGNAGFDVLVPDFDELTVLQVEVKRVPTLVGAAFFLSENERRQALVSGSGWRLWLVASDGTSRDVSWIRDEIRRSDETVRRLLTQGLRPADWLFRLA